MVVLAVVGKLLGLVVLELVGVEWNEMGEVVWDEVDVLDVG